jgi:3-isopropylmalate/(R)-2-methylmalate dehydratase small subunit
VRTMSAASIMGKAWKFGHNVSTDICYPTKYFPQDLTDPMKIASHAMAGADPDFSRKISKNDFIVAGRNFGCGSSRENAAIAIKYNGIAAILAESFARLFYRNAINVGLPVVKCPEIWTSVDTGDHLEVFLDNGTVRNVTKSIALKGEPLPPFILEIIADGGLISHTKLRSKDARMRLAG